MGVAISHSPAWTPVAAATMPRPAVPGLRFRVDSDAANMQSGLVTECPVRKVFRTGSDEAACSRRHGTVINGAGYPVGVGRLGHSRSGVWGQEVMLRCI